MSAPPASLLQFLHRLLARHSTDTSADASLLDRFVCSGDEDAFTALVRRHGPMVFRVCRRVLGDPQAAEDAFQAVFLVLARKARSLRAPESLAAWLHGVAYRIARKARVADSRHQGHQPKAALIVPDPHDDPLADLSARELLDAVDAEIQRLPLAYRLPVILCWLEGNTQEEAARKLGLTPGSVKGRLERGRAKLHARLVRQGLSLSVALAAAEVSKAGAATVPSLLAAEIVHSAVAFAAGKALASTAVSARALVLAKGGLKTMAIAKAKLGLVLLLTGGMVAAGTGVLAHHLLEGDNRSKTQAQAPAQDAAVPQEQAQKPIATDRYGDPLPPGAVVRIGTVRYRFASVGNAFLPDGMTVVSAKQGNAIQFWEARTGRLLHEIDTGELTISQLFSSSGDAKRLAVSGGLRDARPGWRFGIRVFDRESGKVLRTIERAPLEGVNAMALTPDGTLLMSIDRNGSLRVEEVETGVEILRQQFPGDVMASIAFTPDGSTLGLASGPNSRKLFVWDWQAGKKPREIAVGTYVPRSVIFSSDGKMLAACSDHESPVLVVDVASGRLLHKLESPDYLRFSHFHVAFSPDGKVLAAYGGNNDGTVVHLWDPATGRFLKRLTGGGALAFSPDAKLLVAGSQVWDLTTGKDLSANDAAPHGPIERVSAGYGVVVTASGDNTIRIWDAATGTQRRRLVLNGWVRDIALSPDGSSLVSTSLGNDDSVSLWEVTTGRKIYRLAGHGRLGGRRAVAFAPDGNSFLAWGDDMYLRKWDVRTGKAVLEHAIRPTGIRVLGEEAEPFERERLFDDIREGRFTPDGKHLILHADTRFFVFDTLTGKELRSFSSESYMLTGLAISPDCKRLLASAWGKPVQIKLPDGTRQSTSAKTHPVTLWDLSTGKLLKQIVLPEEEPGPVAFTPDGKQFAVASGRPESRIRFIDVTTGQEVRKIEGFRGIVRSLAYMPDGKRLVSGMDDSSALIWDLARQR